MLREKIKENRKTYAKTTFIYDNVLIVRFLENLDGSIEKLSVESKD